MQDALEANLKQLPFDAASEEIWQFSALSWDSLVPSGQLDLMEEEWIREEGRARKRGQA